MTTTITTKWTTIATVGYTGSVSRDENRAAHGGVCHLQVRKGARGILGRKVNANGRAVETGASFDLDADTLAHWQQIGGRMSIEPVYEGGMILWHTLCRGYHLAPVLEYRIDGGDFVTVSEVGELRLPVSHHHDAGHGACLAYGAPK